ncbi:MAG TPA: MEDS domain-containing protein [Polyangiaceae bacterium]
MNNAASPIDLGFVSARVPLGAHVCQIYNDNEERDRALLRFLSSGLQANESTACFTESIDLATLREWFDREGISVDDRASTGQFTFSSAEAVYFEGGYFDPERMLKLLAQFHKESVAQGRTGARVIGEMSRAIATIEGGSRLFEYEARVNRLVREHPITAVCQYDARAFDGATIMDVLAVHPLMVVRGNVIQNPFFVPAETYARQ